MKKERILLGVTMVALLGLNGCVGISMPSFGGSSTAGSGEHFIYKGHDFGASRNETYKKGVVDGCKTAGGDYSKDHKLFQGDDHYRAGWEHGRLHCISGTPQHD